MNRYSFAFLALLTVTTPARGQTYLCFGDSNTFGESGSSRSAYLGVLSDFLSLNVGPSTLINEGLSGETTRDGSDRLDAVLRSRSPEFVLIMHGTNDLFHWTSDITPSDTEGNLRDMVRAARGAGARVVLATVAPRFNDSGDPGNENTMMLANIIRGVARSEGAALADVYESLEPFVSDRTYRDQRHYNETLGAALVAEAFAAAITGRPSFEIDLTPPLPVNIFPAPGSNQASRNAAILIDVFEQKHPPLPETAVLTVDGTSVTPLVDTSVPGEYRYRYDFPAPLRFGQRLSVNFVLSDTDPVTPHQLQLAFSYSVTAGNGTGGDVDKSGRVDGADLAIIASSFGARRGTIRYDIRADVDGSNVVDGLDLAIVAELFGLAP